MSQHTSSTTTERDLSFLPPFSSAEWKAVAKLGKAARISIIASLLREEIPRIPGTTEKSQFVNVSNYNITARDIFNLIVRDDATSEGEISRAVQEALK